MSQERQDEMTLEIGTKIGQINDRTQILVSET